MKLTRNQWLMFAGVLAGSIILATILFNDVSKSTNSDKWFDKTTAWYQDERTRKMVKALHPKFRNKVAEFFTRAETELGFVMYATSGLRPDDEQELLHKQNPSNAKAGYSSHNYGFAIDCNVKKNGKIVLSKASSNSAWENSGIVALARKIGIEWRGNFGSYHDPVHFFLQPNGLSTADMRKLATSGKKDANGYVLV